MSGPLWDSCYGMERPQKKRRIVVPLDDILEAVTDLEKTYRNDDLVSCMQKVTKWSEEHEKWRGGLDVDQTRVFEDLHARIPLLQKNVQDELYYREDVAFAKSCMVESLKLRAIKQVCTKRGCDDNLYQLIIMHMYRSPSRGLITLDNRMADEIGKLSAADASQLSTPQAEFRTMLRDCCEQDDSGGLTGVLKRDADILPCFQTLMETISETRSRPPPNVTVQMRMLLMHMMRRCMAGADSHTVIGIIQLFNSCMRRSGHRYWDFNGPLGTEEDLKSFTILFAQWIVDSVLPPDSVSPLDARNDVIVETKTFVRVTDDVLPSQMQPLELQTLLDEICPAS